MSETTVKMQVMLKLSEADARYPNHGQTAIQVIQLIRKPEAVLRTVSRAE